MATQRLFVALTPPPMVRADLAAVMSSLAGARWVPEENLHLTLRFIGECEPARREALAAALQSVRVEPFLLPVAGLGVFPSRGRARVLWAGAGHAHPRLFQLRKQVDEALLAVDPSLDVHNFQPHITLARLGDESDAKGLARFLDARAPFEAPPFRVSEFRLFASDLRSTGAPRHSIIQTFPLAK